MKNLKTITIPNFLHLLWRGAGGEVFNTPSLCNILIIPSKKGRLLIQPSPQTSPELSSKIAKRWDNTGELILVIFFLITKTVQMYVFI